MYCFLTDIRRHPNRIVCGVIFINYFVHLSVRTNRTMKNKVFRFFVSSATVVLFIFTLHFHRIESLYYIGSCVCFFYKRHSHTCTLFVRVKYFLGLYESLCVSTSCVIVLYDEYISHLVEES